MTDAPLRRKVRMLKAEVIETPLYGYVTWTAVSTKHFVRLRSAHQVPLRVMRFQRRLRTDHTTLSYAKALKKTLLREHRNDHPKTAPLLYGVRGVAKRGPLTQSCECSG